MSFNILIVDDDFINRKLISTLLKKHPDIVGTMIEAENGAEALSILRENSSINMILLDIIMPILDGREFLKIFRSNEENNGIPVLVLFLLMLPSSCSPSSFSCYYHISSYSYSSCSHHIPSHFPLLSFPLSHLPPPYPDTFLLALFLQLFRTFFGYYPIYSHSSSS